MDSAVVAAVGSISRARQLTCSGFEALERFRADSRCRRPEHPSCSRHCLAFANDNSYPHDAVFISHGNYRCWNWQMVTLRCNCSLRARSAAFSPLVRVHSMKHI
jgi:hypothetical protein